MPPAAIVSGIRGCALRQWVRIPFVGRPLGAFEPRGYFSSVPGTGLALLDSRCRREFGEGTDEKVAEEVEMRFVLMVALVVILAAVADGEAQTSNAPRGYFDVTLVGAQPRGTSG